MFQVVDGGLKLQVETIRMMQFGVRSAMLPGSIRCLAFASLLFVLNTAAAEQCPSATLADFDDRQVLSREYNLWLEVDTIARMPDPQRAIQIPHVYRDIFSDLHKRWYALDNWMIFPARLGGYRESKTPEQRVKGGSNRDTRTCFLRASPSRCSLVIRNRLSL